jgi:hypothetical protein
MATLLCINVHAQEIEAVEYPGMFMEGIGYREQEL